MKLEPEDTHVLKMDSSAAPTTAMNRLAQAKAALIFQTLGTKCLHRDLHASPGIQ
jgi:hypothetical protein